MEIFDKNGKIDKKWAFSEIEKEFNEKLGINPSSSQLEKLVIFMDMLIETNKVMNLTAITDPKEIILRHFVDSLELMKLESFKAIKSKGEKVADIGTGAGFPGLPLAIMNDDIEFLLADSLKKRIGFLESVIEKIGQKNAVVSHMRAEDAKMGTVYREKYFFAISRGVTKISTLSEYLMPYVKKTGKMVMYKMADCDKEFEEGKNAVKVLGGKFLEKYEYDLVEGEPKRALLIYEKIRETDKQYPRQGNKPKISPL